MSVYIPTAFPDSGTGSIDGQAVVQHATSDLMLVRLPVGVKRLGITPLPVALSVPRTLASGQLAEIAGLGLTDDGVLGKRSVAVEEIRRVGTDGIFVSGGFVSGACIGDSGGPLVVRDEKGVARVAGVLSTGSPTCVGEDRYEPLAPYADWLRANVDEQAASSDCGALDERGRCFGDVAAWCDNGTLRGLDCAPNATCGWRPELRANRCVSPGACATAGQYGTCRDNVALWCNEGMLHEQPCDECSVCARLSQTGQVQCLGASQVDRFLSSESH